LDPQQIIHGEAFTSTSIDLAARPQSKPGSLHVWFATTGKKVNEIKKIAPGKHAWVGAEVPF
jgi:hypothetical protein